MNTFALPSSGDLTLALATGQTSTLADISSGAGFEVDVARIDWGTDSISGRQGIEWFDLTGGSSVGGGAGKSVSIKIKDNLMSLDASRVQEARIPLSNKIVAGGRYGHPGYSCLAAAGERFYPHRTADRFLGKCRGF